MKLNTLYTFLAVIALGYGMVAILLPGFLIQLLWRNPAGPEGYLLLQGWGSCLVAFSVIAWGARRLESAEARRAISLGFFTYFVIAAILWLVDALSRGWTIFSALTLALLVLFALGFGYWAMVRRASMQVGAS
jgi:uncharacterized PurR-regulated membrane protein YhhQ (DUF165 family)